MHRLFTALLVLFAVLLPAMSHAQVPPPIPHPRIERPGDAHPPANDQPSLLAPQNAGQGGNDTTLSPDTSPVAGNPPAPDVPAVAQPVTLSARVKEDGPSIPSGLMWRIFATRPDETGKLPMLFKSEDPSVTLSLVPGRYLVHVAYGRAQASDTLDVVPGPNVKTIILDAGALKLRAAVTTEIPIPANELTFDISTTGLNGEQIPVVNAALEDEMIYLNAGVYSVVSKWGKQNATVRADIRVEPGQVTEATLFHKAARVSFVLVSKPGGEAIADVDWKVQDKDGKTMLSYFGAFPTAVLAKGDYTVIAQSGDAVFNRDFQVQPGRPIEIEVLTTIY